MVAGLGQVKEMFHMDNNQIEELFDDIDLSDNDEIEWQEFVAAAMGLKIQL